MSEKNSRPPNHPVSAKHLAYVTEGSSANLPSGQQYGIFTAPGFISCNPADPTDYEVILSANTSAPFSLEAGYVYSLTGKLMVMGPDSPPIFTYFPETMIRVCKTDHFIGDVTNKTSVDAIGTAISVDRETTDNNGVVENNLMVTMLHNDWDPQARCVRAFNVRYKIPGRRNMANTHVLFQPNREFFLIGFLCDWDMDKEMPVVEVLALSWINPPNAARVQVTGNRTTPNNSPSRPGRNVVHFSQRTQSRERRDPSAPILDQGIGSSTGCLSLVEDIASQNETNHDPVETEGNNQSVELPSQSSPRKRGKISLSEPAKRKKDDV
ncbi:uncharacterized protein PGTG_07749 [Puccinia graminis f. sp. tritici CRL 75-36-700-3]|uniref:Uncharacterized protein n=1 Tax=Puccinia graminis f. sp. tritici (strain CRL 75-36-700-3 / race SCCL) TaxID=418459 RepID=E3KBK4_PUCGT|nr:uncharacterized protein PGTG_07749 [Puccinia graminis f. sp. tritici CRL 75-36-700-3]EFP81500.2 hypothetical protein PGTG_07749 [Puccinia graminis f. sp. tritici CRL 75-36-700-3]